MAYLSGRTELSTGYPQVASNGSLMGVSGEWGLFWRVLAFKWTYQPKSKCATLLSP